MLPINLINGLIDVGAAMLCILAVISPRYKTTSLEIATLGLVFVGLLVDVNSMVYSVQNCIRAGSLIAIGAVAYIVLLLLRSLAAHHHEDFMRWLHAINNKPKGDNHGPRL